MSFSSATPSEQSSRRKGLPSLPVSTFRLPLRMKARFNANTGSAGQTPGEANYTSAWREEFSRTPRASAAGGHSPRRREAEPGVSHPKSPSPLRSGRQEFTGCSGARCAGSLLTSHCSPGSALPSPGATTLPASCAGSLLTSHCSPGPALPSPGATTLPASCAGSLLTSHCSPGSALPSPGATTLPASCAGSLNRFPAARPKLTLS